MRRLMTIVIISIATLLTVNLSYVSAEGQLKIAYSNVANEYHKIMSEVKNGWQDTEITEIIKLKYSNGLTKAYLYRVGSSLEQKGYMVVMELNGVVQISEATFEGDDPLKDDKEKLYYIAPMGFFSKDEISSYEEKREKSLNNKEKLDLNSVYVSRTNKSNIVWPWENSSPLDPDNLIQVPSSYLSTYYISYYSEQMITSTPEYFNFDFGPVSNGCGPTTAAMMTSFYDRVVLTSLYEGVLPLDHYDSNNNADTDVDEHIITMADYLQTCDDITGDLTDRTNCTGTSAQNAVDGLEDYFNDQGYPQFNAHYSTEFSEYDNLIMESNVVYLRLFDDNGTTSTEDDLRHAVLGIGIAYPYGSPTQLIVRYNWQSRSGEYHVSSDLFNGFIYMSRT